MLAERFFSEAYGLESLAANMVADYDAEPTRSVLHRSAATLAIDCGRLQEAARLARRGLRGSPPPEIASEIQGMLRRMPTWALPAEDEVDRYPEILLNQILEESRRPRDPAAREHATDLIKTFVEQVLGGAMTVGKDAEAMINARIAQIDELLSNQLNEVMHAPEFQELEGSWRGLKYLLDCSETSDKLKIRVLNVSKKELLADLQRAREFDQSALFKKVYEDEYGIFGGVPFAALVGDYEFGKNPQDTEVLEKISNVAAAAHAPFLAAASPDLLSLESFTQLGQPRDLSKVFDTTEYVKWKSFRQSEDSRYVGLTLPHILMRLPYGKETSPVEAFHYE